MTDRSNNLSGPEGSNRRADDRPRSRGRRKATVPIPAIDEILGQLVQLNGAVLIGAVSAKQAALIQRNLKTVLDVQFKRASRGDAGPSQEALVDLCRRDPRALEAVEAFLTDEQLQALMAEIAGSPDEDESDDREDAGGAA